MSTNIDPAYVKANFPVMRPEWLDLHHEEVIEPSLPIVDPHHHLWELPNFDYLRSELLADVGSGHNVRATVYVDCKSRYRLSGPEALRPVGETEFVVAETPVTADQDIALCAGIVGWADLLLGADVRSPLEEHIEAGKGRFRGIRSRATWHADSVLHPAGEGRSGLLLESVVQQAVETLGRLDLSLDLWVFHTQLKEVGKLAAACPMTPIVLNHCGGPLGVGPFRNLRREVFEGWRKDISELAQHENVVVKIGGLAMPRFGFGFHEALAPVHSDALAEAWAPYIGVCIDAFGAERCMFESNFPVDKGACSYVTLWNAFKRVTQGYSAAERAALFSLTASRIYRL
jgi:L-fuconolactonase